MHFLPHLFNYVLCPSPSPYSATECSEVLLSPQNGTLVFSSGRDIGSTATYSCVDGFDLILGDEMRICQTNGQWSGIAPMCGSKLHSLPPLDDRSQACMPSLFFTYCTPLPPSFSSLPLPFLLPYLTLPSSPFLSSPMHLLDFTCTHSGVPAEQVRQTRPNNWLSLTINIAVQ